MGLTGAPSQDKKGQSIDYIDQLIRESTQPPFCTDLNMSAEIVSYLEQGDEGLKALCNRNDLIKEMTGLDHVIVIDQDELDAIEKIEVPDSLNEEEKSFYQVQEWLKQEHSAYLQAYQNFYKDAFNSEMLEYPNALDVISRVVYHNLNTKTSVNPNTIMKGLTNGKVDTDDIKFGFIRVTGDDNILYDPATVFIHELQHATGQKHLEEYFDALESQGIPRDVTKHMLRHCWEIESDLAIVNVLSAVQKNAEYNIEINTSFQLSVLIRLKNGNKEEDHQHSDSESTYNFNLGEHDTTAFIKEYQLTGEMPNYFETYKALNEFYDKTYKAYQKEWESKFKTEEIPEIPDEAIMWIVQSNMMVKTDTYSPAAQNIAQHYLTCMDELGYESKPVELCFLHALDKQAEERYLEQSDEGTPAHSILKNKY